MSVLFIIVGFFLAFMGIKMALNPDSMLPKIKKTSGKKTEIYQVQYNPSFTRAIGIMLAIFGVFFAFISITLIGTTGF